MKGITTMSVNVTPNTNPAAAFEAEANLKARSEAEANGLPILKSAFEAFKATTEQMAKAGQAIATIRVTFPVIIDGIAYPDVFGTQQATKQAVAEYFKANGLPSNSEAPSFHSALRYHSGKAANAMLEANPGTYRPDGFGLEGSKWVRTVTPEQATEQAAEKQVKALQRVATNQLVKAIATQGAKSPLSVVNATTNLLGSVDLSEMPLKERSVLLEALGQLIGQAETLVEYLTGGQAEEQAAA